ncbi:HlyC/CorC family transporter [Alkaliphilus crotonatoxidans]
MWELLVLILLLMLSAFFSASETALMSLSKIRVRHLVDEKIHGAETVFKLLDEPNKLLGTILVGNNIVNIAASALATSIALEAFGNNGVAIATGIMTFSVLVFSEITPKSLAAQNAEAISLKISRPMAWIVMVLRPIVIVFNFVTDNLMKLMGINRYNDRPFITEEELKTVVTVSQEEGVLEVDEKEMIYNVFEFGDSQIKDVMVQRTDIIALDVNLNYEETINLIRNEKLSRYPVYDEGIDNIIGVLNVRDLFTVEDIKETFCLRDYLRKAFFTFEYKKVADLFKEMKKNKNHMAIVLDEYGGTAGIVTMEDLIEEIVGDIQDEYDEQENDFEMISEHEYLVKGNVKIELVNEMIGLNLESEDFDSIGGFIIGELGRFPKKGESVNYQHVKLVLEEIEGNRIKKVRLVTTSS